MTEPESSVDARMLQMEQRLKLVEDELAICRLVNAYGPAVDSGNSEIVANLWTADGIYDIGSESWPGREAISGMVEGPTHQGLIHEGVAHVQGYPQVLLDGDQAVATGYSRIYRRTEDGYRVWRVSANRWELERHDDGWRCVRRTTRLMDGSDEARSLLAKGVRP